MSVYFTLSSGDNYSNVNDLCDLALNHLDRWENARTEMKPEQAFSLWLRKKLPGHVVRVENSIGAGMPDISWCHQGNEIWIETKVHDQSRALLRQFQYSFMMARAQQGGKCLVVVYNRKEDHIFGWRAPFNDFVLRNGYLDISRSTCLFDVALNEFHFGVLLDAVALL